MQKNISIMLIDDNEIDLFINQKTVESLNFNGAILSFSSGRGALNYLQLIENMKGYRGIFSPQIILLEINMPDMGGFDFLDEFDKFKMAKENLVLIFLLSCTINPYDLSKIINHKNVSGFIQKPLTAVKIVSQCESALKFKQKVKANNINFNHN
ncbi:MAG: response regulator [Bacteroidia bacterium]|nr:response regulator [Bacteroidia bacterium]